MSENFFLQQAPFVVPTTDGKLIEEHVGPIATDESNLSVAHMVAPPGWCEPHQNPEFDEYTLMVRGRKQIEINGDTVTLKSGENAGMQTDQYSASSSNGFEYCTLTPFLTSIDSPGLSVTISPVISICLRPRTIRVYSSNSGF